MSRAWLSLGSNIEPEKHLRAALTELRARFGAITVSPIYRTPAVGFDGPEFLNLAVGVDTNLDPLPLNIWLHALEDRNGRLRDGPRFSSRTLDIDIVLFDQHIIDGPGNLHIPRDDLRHAFVLKPMADIAPDLRHPVSGLSMAQLWAASDERVTSLERVADL